MGLEFDESVMKSPSLASEERRRPSRLERGSALRVWRLPEVLCVVE